MIKKPYLFGLVAFRAAETAPQEAPPIAEVLEAGGSQSVPADL